MQVRLNLNQVLDAERFGTAELTPKEQQQVHRAKCLQALLQQPWGQPTSMPELCCMLLCVGQGKLDACAPAQAQVWFAAGTAGLQCSRMQVVHTGRHPAC